MELGVLFIAAVMAGLPLPPECELPALREVSQLKPLAAQEGTLSSGLDSVATWCFDEHAEWTGGVGTSKTKGKKSALGAKANPDAEPSAECKKAIASCEAARAVVQSKGEVAQTADAAASDWKRPYHENVYTPKRSGVSHKPAVAAACNGRGRSELYAQAQGRMDLARWFSMVQSEYADYRAWLMQESMKCRKNVLAGEKNALRTSVSFDAPPTAPVAATPASAPPVAEVKTPAPTAPLTGEHAALEAKPMLEKWKYLSERHAALEKDRDYAFGFLASRELRGCACTRVNPSAIVRSIEKQEGGPAGMALLNSEDAANTKCTVCQLDAFSTWKPRVARQCAMMDELTEFELNKLQQSDDANGLPPRCFEETRTRRAEKNKTAVAAPAVAKDGGSPALTTQRWVPPQAALLRADAGVKPLPASASTGTTASAVFPPLDGGAQLTDVNGYTYYKPVAPKGTATGPGVSAPANSGDEFVAPSAYAPIPSREEGRVYVRLSMSAACVAEILPGPIQARTGDLLLVPFGAKSLQVKSPCGGLAEIYFGREATPRFSEVFTRTQPLSFVFQAQ